MLKYDNNHHYTNDDKVHNCEYKSYHVHIFRMAEFPHPDDLYNYPSCNILQLYMLSIHHLNKKKYADCFRYDILRKLKSRDYGMFL